MVTGPSSIRVVLAPVLAWTKGPETSVSLITLVERAVVSERKKKVGAVEVLLPRSAPASESFREAKARIVARFERRCLRHMLAAHEDNISKAAEASQKNRRTFWELMRKHGIDARKFRV